MNCFMELSELIPKTYTEKQRIKNSLSPSEEDKQR